MLTTGARFVGEIRMCFVVQVNWIHVVHNQEKVYKLFFELSRIKIRVIRSFATTISALREAKRRLLTYSAILMLL